jgi:hypothetical protein
MTQTESLIYIETWVEAEKDDHTTFRVFNPGLQDNGIPRWQASE